MMLNKHNDQIENLVLVLVAFVDLLFFDKLWQDYGNIKVVVRFLGLRNKFEYGLLDSVDLLLRCAK